MEGQIEILLGGKSRKLRYSMWAIEKNQELLDKNKGALHYSTTVNTAALIYAGLLNQYQYEKKDIDFSENDVAGWVYDLFDSENGFEVIDAVMECFTACNAYRNLLKRKGEEDKKKSNGMMSTASHSESLA